MGKCKAFCFLQHFEFQLECEVNEIIIMNEISGWYLKRTGVFTNSVTIPLDRDEVLINRSHSALRNCIQISRRHACFQKTTEGRWYLKDLGSTNGLYVNHSKISPLILHPVQTGDTIGFGVAHGESEVEFEFVLCHGIQFPEIIHPSTSTQHSCLIDKNFDSKPHTSVNSVKEMGIPTPHWYDENGIAKKAQDLCQSENSISSPVHKKDKIDEVTESHVSDLKNVKLEHSSGSENINITMKLEKDFALHISQNSTIDKSLSYKDTKRVHDINEELDLHSNLNSEDSTSSVNGHTLENHNKIKETVAPHAMPAEHLSNQNGFKITKTNSDITQQNINFKMECKIDSAANSGTVVRSGNNVTLSEPLPKYPELKNPAVVLERCDNLLLEIKSASNSSNIIKHKKKTRRHSSSESDEIVRNKKFRRRNTNIICSSSSDESSGRNNDSSETFVISDDADEVKYGTFQIKSSLCSNKQTCKKTTVGDALKLKDKPLKSADNFVKCSDPTQEQKCLSTTNSSSQGHSSLVEDQSDCFSYSQQDEVIVISDDEEYITSSQNVHSDFPEIKSEAIDEYADMDWESVFQDDEFHSDVHSKRTRESDDVEKFSSLTSEVSVQNDALGFDEKETLCTNERKQDIRVGEEIIDLTINESDGNDLKHEGLVNSHFKTVSTTYNTQICAQDDCYDFPKKTNCVTNEELLTRIQWTDNDREVTKSAHTEVRDDFNSYDLDSENNTHSHAELENVSLPSGIQNSESTPLSENLHTAMTSLKQIDNDEKNIKKHKEKPLSMLTDPLPMLYRPKSRRGHEEWFSDHYDDGARGESSNLPSSNNTLGPSPAVHCENRSKKIAKKRFENNRNQKQNLREKVMKKMDHRIPIPGGGSDVVRQEVNANNSFNRKIKYHESASKISSRQSQVKRKLKHSEELEGIKNKNVNRFSSRQNILVEDVRNSAEVNKKIQRSKKNANMMVSATRSLTNYKIPKKSNETKSSTSTKKGSVNNNQVTVTTLTKKISVFSGQSYDKRTCNTLPQSSKTIDENENLIPQSSSLMQSYLGKTAKETCDLVSNSKKKKEKRVTFSDKVTSCIVESSENYLRNISVEKSFLNTKASSSNNVKRGFMLKNELPPASCTKRSIKTTIDDLLLKILTWNVQWLKEREKCFHLPPVLTDGPEKVQLSYHTYDSYFKTYCSLLLLETWESLYETCKKKQSLGELLSVVNTYKMAGNLMILECQTVIDNYSFKRIFIDGALLILDLRLFNDTAIRTFGYVYECRSDICRPEIINNSVLQDLPAIKEKNSFLVSFKIKIKPRRNVSIDFKKVMKFRILFYLKPMIRKFEALLGLSSSILFKDILKPRMNTCTFSSPNKHLAALGLYNSDQRHAILGAVDAVLRPFPIPQIILLQGPPGTGKTNVLFGIIQHLFHHKSEHLRIKLLVTAPSNAAVDEIGRRLVHDRNNIMNTDKKKLRFVRIGQYDQIHSDLRRYSLEDLVKANLQQKSEGQEKDLDDKIHDMKESMNNIKQEIAKQKQARCFMVVKNLEKQVSTYDKRLKQYQLERSNVRTKLQPNNDSVKYRLRTEILTKADVILSTLSSCRQSALEVAFGAYSSSNVHFTCCIVDEATQCIEPDLLIPLFYNMSKLVLVGDPCQLPATVISQEAVRNGFQISLFERIFKYFEENHDNNPVFMLTEQYRMHPEICEFPSKYFYSGSLTTSQRILGSYDPFPLKPYIIFDLVNGLEVNKASKVNYPEVQFVLTIINCLENELHERYTKGIITPYQGQRQIYLEHLSKQRSSTIEVNTIDGFQGRQKDVIILSCVRAQNSKGSIGFLANKQRLNVAITRARYSLIICGHLKTLEEDTDWKSLIDNARERNLVVLINSEEQSLDLLRILRK